MQRAGFNQPAAAMLSARIGQTGGHPPLNEGDARTLFAGVAGWLEATRLYAATVGLDERRTCPDCDDILAGDAHDCPETAQPDAPLLSWTSQAVARLRRPSWIIFVHGMNTRGPWQEELGWQLSLLGGTPAPVRIHKYGQIRIGAISRRRLRTLADQLHERIQELQSEIVAATGRTDPPDILAHSLGTWLVGHALRRNPDLQLGRVILTGSILQPTFEWDDLIEQGRVQAVLNHRADRDAWVPLAQYAIPDSGPSGRVAFSAQRVIEIRQPGWAHSDYFTHVNDGEKRTNLTSSLHDIWGPALTWPAANAALLTDAGTCGIWRPSPLSRAHRKVR